MLFVCCLLRCLFVFLFCYLISCLLLFNCCVCWICIISLWIEFTRVVVDLNLILHDNWQWRTEEPQPGPNKHQIAWTKRITKGALRQTKRTDMNWVRQFKNNGCETTSNYWLFWAYSLDWFLPHSTRQFFKTKKNLITRYFF